MNHKSDELHPTPSKKDETSDLSQSAPQASEKSSLLDPDLLEQDLPLKTLPNVSQPAEPAVPADAPLDTTVFLEDDQLAPIPPFLDDESDDEPLYTPLPSQPAHAFSLELDESMLPPDVTPTPIPPTYQSKKRKVVKEKIPIVNMIIKMIVALSIILVSVGVAVIIILSIQDVMGFSKGNDTIEIHVKEGQSIPIVAQQMEDEGLIRSAFLFRSYLRVFIDREVVIHYGKYTFTKNMAYAEIVETLESKGQTTSIQLTIIEGDNVSKIAEKLEDLSICPSDAFIEAVNHGEWLTEDGEQRFSFIEDLMKQPDVEKRPFRLEGYLFPDTYNFKTGTPAEDVVARFLANFERKFDSHLRYLTRQTSYTIDDIVSLASIVEGEASGTEMMPRVSSVYWNRLNNSATFPKLQADPTTRYARDVLAPLGTSNDILMAYDTYQSEGLPLGPINTAGYRALEATLKPVDEDYFFFVTSKNMQIFYFSKTYEKHQENIQKARTNEAE